MKRIDALPPDRARLAGFTGQILDPVPDPELDALVREAAAVTDAPIAAVSLVLERIQLFRAQHGMPADLAAIRATDRDASFCQLVVRDRAAMEVTDAVHDERVPQDLVERYGINSYLGVPLTVSGQALGTLCVIDLRPREFTPVQKATLVAIAERVRVRLEVLAGMTARRHRARGGLRPAFAEARNLLMPLESNLEAAQVHVAELRTLARLVEYVASHGSVPAVGSLAGASRALDDLDAQLADAVSLAADLRHVVLALQTAVVPTEAGTGAATAVAAALSLAHHDTKLVGGVRPRGALDNRPLAAPGTAVVTLVSAALAELGRLLHGRRATQGLDLVIRIEADATIVELTAPEFGTELLTDPARLLDQLAVDEPAITVAALPGGVALYLAAA